MSEKEPAVLGLYEKGVHVNKICVDLGISVSTLYKILEKYGVKLRQK